MDTGLDRLAALPHLVARLRGSRVGLLTHPAAVARDLRHAAAVLAGLGVLPRVFFGPEHGYGGEAQDMIGVGDERLSGEAPVVSLYGEDFASLSPTPAQLASIDVLVIDLADVGARFYTFVWTALLALRAAARAGVHVLLLDRPNPLGSGRERVEGRLPDPAFLSFVGLERVPVRHGLTVGEIVSLFAEGDGLALGPGGALSVVPVAGLAEPDSGAGEWDRPFVMTSPNMPSLETARVYPGGCLVEGTNLSEGRGTTRPFEIVGAPFVDGHALAAALGRAPLEGFFARPITFMPMFHKHKGKLCGGVQVHVTDPARFRPYEAYLTLIGAARRLAGEAFAFRTERYEFIDTIPAFDLLTGSAEARERLVSGEDPGAVARDLSEPGPGWDERAAAARRAVERASAAGPSALLTFLVREEAIAWAKGGRQSIAG